MIDWIKIKNEYINGNISYRKLAEKYNISFSALRLVAEKEKWVDLKKEQQHKISTKLAQKTADLIVDKEVDRIARITFLADRLSDKLEQAIEELDRAMVTHKTKIKTVEYNHEIAKGKPTKEVIEEEEKLIEVIGIIDKAGLKQLTAALKDIKDIQTADNNTDTTTLDRVIEVLDAVKGQKNNGRHNHNTKTR